MTKMAAACPTRHGSDQPEPVAQSIVRLGEGGLTETVIALAADNDIDRPS